MKLKVKKLHKDAIIPEYKSAGAAGFDLHGLNETGMTGTHTYERLYPGYSTIVRTGLAFEIPEGYELQIRSRSGLGIKQGLAITHGVGTIDSDYRGEITIAITNFSTEIQSFDYTGRLCQAVLSPVVQAEFEEVEELSETERGENGFGSTGQGNY